MLLFVLAFTPGCGGPDANPDGGGPQKLPDGFIQTGCLTTNDCDDNSACTDDSCGPEQRCLHTQKACTLAAGMDPLCNEAICEPQNGGCTVRAKNEHGTCTLSDGMPGECQAGLCTTIPQCAIQSIVVNCTTSNHVMGSLSGNGVLDDYSCAKGEIGPEKAHRLWFRYDRIVTLTLTGATDLDLIVLESPFCTSSAACAASALTTGSGNEEVTFTAKANTTYAIVVESRVAASASYTLDAKCAGCAPTRTLGCNETLVGNSAGSPATIGGWICDPMTPGPEDTYRIAPTATADYRIRLTGPTQDLDLILMEHPASQECDPEAVCRESSTQAGTADERIDFRATGGAKYDIVVEARAGGGPYQLTVECPLSCVGENNWIDCDTIASIRNDDATKSTDIIDHWQCDPGTDGPEVIYIFQPPQAGSYTFDLGGLTADLDLVVMEEDPSSVVCDAANPCFAVSKLMGTAGESVTFLADATKLYFIAVDGKNGAVSPFTLAVRSSACPP